MPASFGGPVFLCHSEDRAISPPPKTFVTPEEYLELERKAEHKSEYYNGEIFAMSGVTRRHDAIAVQLLYLIGQHLRGKRCRCHTPICGFWSPRADCTRTPTCLPPARSHGMAMLKSIPCSTRR